MIEALAGVDRDQTYGATEAFDLLKSLPAPKFDESFEIVVRLGVDPRKSDQQVRGAALLPQRCPLEHPEPVLLIHHHHPQITENHILLQQRMRAHHNPRLPRCQVFHYRPSFRLPEAPRQIMYRQSQRPDQLANSSRMLCC